MRRRVNFTIRFDEQIIFKGHPFYALTFILDGLETCGYEITVPQLSIYHAKITDMIIMPSMITFKLPTAPYLVKLACVENFIDVYGLVVIVSDGVGLKNTVDMLNKFLGTERITSE